MITIVPRLILIWCTSFLILTNVIGQQVIPELTIDFDQGDVDKVVVLPVNDLDGSGVFGINNGSFEITDSEGTECPNPFPNTNGLNDNSALVISSPFLLNYCELSFSVEVSLSSADLKVVLLLMRLIP